MTRAEPRKPIDPGISRQNFLKVSGLAAGAGLVAHATGTAGAAPPKSTDTIDFYGTHQEGIATPAQDALCFAALDLASQSRTEVRDLLRLWSKAAANLTKGKLAGQPNNRVGTAPVDTGESLGLPASMLTITFGFGRSLFEENGEDRFGLAARRPPALQPIPSFKHDALDPSLCGGDICIQACSDDAQVAFHAIHTLTHMASGSAGIRWLQLGFGRTSSTTKGQQTPRNIMGFKDGTNNIKSDDQTSMNAYVWAGDEGPRWMIGGTYLVARRIEMRLTNWDAATLGEQQHTFGRFKSSGAPLTGMHESDPINLKARGPDGKLVIPKDAHIRVASPEKNGGHQLLRRGYSFSEGFDVDTGQMKAGLFFICFQRNPEDQFVAIQHNLSNHDHLNRYIRHTGSSVFAVPPGAAHPGTYVGAQLFD